MKIQTVFSNVYKDIEKELDDIFERWCKNYRDTKNPTILYRDAILRLLQDLLQHADDRVGDIDIELQQNNNNLISKRVSEFHEKFENYVNKKEELLSPAQDAAQKALNHRKNMEQLLYEHQGGKQEGGAYDK